MKDFEKIEQLLKTKKYTELDKLEQEIVNQQLGQEVYEELHDGIHQLVHEEIPVSRRVKQSLVAELKQKKRRVLPDFFRFSIPAYTQLVPLAIIVYLLFFIPKKEKIVTQDRLVEVTVRDTVEIMKLDTLWLERIIRVETPVAVNDPVTSNIEASDEIVQRSLLEQKEVMDLVVRGDD